MTLRYFLTYRGVKLPLALTEELAPEALNHRNTYIRAEHDEAGRVLWLEKVVYGEVELRHEYRYGDDGTLCGAVIGTPDDEPREVQLEPSLAGVRRVMTAGSHSDDR